MLFGNVVNLSVELDAFVVLFDEVFLDEIVNTLAYGTLIVYLGFEEQITVQEL